MPTIDPLPISLAYIRATTNLLPPSDEASSFLIDRKNKSYKHQYSNIYFVRLRLLRGFVEERAHRRWKNLAGNPILVPRVLEVTKSHLCYIIGTVYMDMPLKPNVMEDIARDQSIPPPPPNPKFHSLEDNVMLEDESGRIRLVGEQIRGAKLVTGIIIGALGAETANGDFEVIDICYPGMAPQTKLEDAATLVEEDNMDIDGQISSSTDEWIGVVSGLNVGSPSPSDAQIQMLVEYLTGEGGGVADQTSATRISRLIIAGNSLALTPSGKGESADIDQQRKSRRYGNEATTFSAHPVISLSDHLLDIGSTIPIHILPGETDPSGVIIPQQPFPHAMFGQIATMPTFSCETNPTYLRLECKSTTNSSSIARNLLINSGQPLNDMFKYLPSPPNTRLSILESTLRWRHMAPTAPDTLWCHPYFGGDPFIITETPDLYIVGNQQRFSTKLVVETRGDDDSGGEPGPKARCRIVMVPEFARTGVLVLINLQSLQVKTVTFAVEGMTGGEEVLQPNTSRAPSPSPPELVSSATQLSSSSSFS